MGGFLALHSVACVQHVMRYITRTLVSAIHMQYVLSMPWSLSCAGHNIKTAIPWQALAAADSDHLL